MPAHADIPHTENVKIHQTAEDLSNSMPNDKGSELVSKHSTSEGGGSLHLTQQTHMPKVCYVCYYVTALVEIGFRNWERYHYGMAPL